ncbi:hypothetical protein IL306_011384, partial [Fusarium sp. DS 682]
MRPLFVVLRHLLFASLARGQFGVQNDRSVLGINNEFSGVCYTYVSVYPVLADPDYITITKPYRGSVTTQYTVPPQGDEPGIVIVEQPGGSSAPENVVIPATDDRSYVIIIRPHQGPNPISAPITQVVPPRSGQPGQIIIETPETQVGDATPGVLQPVTLEPKETTGYVTVLQPLTGTLASLQLITISPTGTNRGSVIINVPTSSLNRGSLQGLTLEPAQDGDYVTVIEPAGTGLTGNAPVRLTIPPSGGNPGTVIIQTPVPGTLRPLALESLTPNTLGALGLAGQTITLQPVDATGYVTIIEPAEGSVTPTAPIQTTIPPTGTKPGTVLIQTPPGWNAGGDGVAFQPTRTRPQGSVSYTTITRGVPMGFGGSGSDSGSNSDGGSNGGSGSGGGDDEGDGSGSVQGRPGQGGDGESGPRQTITIPPEGGNPGTVLVLTPEDPNNPQTNNNDGGEFPAGTQPAGDDGNNGVQATGGSSAGSQGGSGAGSGSANGGNGQSGGADSSNNGGSGGGSNSGSGSLSGQGGSSSNGGSDDDDDDLSGDVQGVGSGSEGDDEDGASGNGGSSGSNNGNTSGNGGSSGSSGGDTAGSGGSGGTQGGAQGGSDNEDGQEGSGTRSADSSSSTKGASSNGSGDNDGPTSGDTESEGEGSEGGSDSDGGSSGGTGSTSGGQGSSGDDDEDSESGGNAAGGDGSGEPGQSSSSRRESTSKRSTTRSPIVRTSPSTYIVTSSSTVFTITADVVETLTNDEPQSTRASSSTRRLTAGVEGLGGSEVADTDRTTFRRPTNSRATTADADVTSGGDGEGSNSPQTTASPSTTRRAGSSDFSGTVDTRIRPGGSGLSSTSRSRTSTSGQATRSVSDETTIVDSGPVETNDPGPDVQETTSSGGNAARSSSTRSAQGSSASQSTSSRNPAGATSASSSVRFTARPEGFSGTPGNAGGGATSQASQRTSSSASGQSTASANDDGVSDGNETSTQRSGTGNSSQAGVAGTSYASARSSATASASGGSSSGANTRAGDSSSASGAATGSSRPTSSQTSQSTSATRRSEEINIETIIGTQSVAESDRVEQPGDSSSTRQVTSSTTSAAALTGQPAGGVGGSTTDGTVSQTPGVEDEDASATSSREALTGGAGSGGAGESSGSEDDTDAETSAASSDTDSEETGSATVSDDAQETGVSTGLTQPEDGDTSLISPQVPVPTDPLPDTASRSQPFTAELEGISVSSDSSFESPQMPLPTAVSTGPLPDTDLLSTATDEGSPMTESDFEAPTGSQAASSDNGGLDPDAGESVTDEPTGSETPALDSSSDALDDEASETGSVDTDETGIETSGQTTQSGSSDGGEDDREASTTGDDDSQASETDAAESETSDLESSTGGSGSGAGSNTDDASQTITDASNGNPTAGIPTDNTPTTGASDGALATITVFRAGRGSARTTLYVPPQASNDPWTVVIETPVSETQSEAATARGDDDVLATTSAIGGNTNVTIFRAGSSPARRTLYVPPRAANEPGTIVIETPAGTGLSATATATETGLETPGVRPNITVYSSGTAASRITIYVPPTASGEDGYIIIETPVSKANSDATESIEDGSGPTAGSPAGIANVTVYSSGTASEERTLYIPPTASGEAGTIVIETPISNPDAEETEDADNGSQTTGLEPGVRPNVTVYSSGTASERITLYIPPTASGEAGTIIIETPVSDEGSDTITGGPGDESGNTATSSDRSAVTIYTQATGSTGNTRYISPTASGEQGTYIIETLAPGVAEETASDDSAEITSPEASITPAPTDDGFSEESGNLTLYRAGDGTERSTIFIPPETTGDPWTIVIETPVSQTQLVETGTASGFQTTVSAITGSANFTIFRAGVAPTRKTLYVAPKTSGAPGTVIIETPVPRSQTSGLTANPEALITVSAGFNTTIFVSGTGTVRTTYYVPASDPNEPGTVYIETPLAGEETEDPSGASATGTDVVPGSGINVTEYSGVAGSVTRTIYIPPTAPGGDGTIIIETPTDDDNDTIVAQTTVTVFSGGPGSVTRTVYVPPTASGEAGTLYIETPTGSDATATVDEVISATRTVTVFTGVLGSVTRTVYVPLTAINEPGTLFIETPVDGTQATATDDEDAIPAATTVTIFSGGLGSVTRSVYVPPTASGEAGTMYIETPTDGAEATATGDEDVFSAVTTVTIFSGGPTSATRTVYIPPTASGEAGTLIIETPTEEAASSATSDNDEDAVSAATTVTIFSGGPASVTRTVYIPPTASGEAGTLIIETPTEGSQASATDDTAAEEAESATGAPTEAEGEAISAATTVTIFSGGPAAVTSTTYIPPTASGEAGTLVIVTPTGGSDASQTSDDDDSSETGSITGVGEITAGTTVTVFSGGSGSATRTIYIPPTASGEAGTLIVEAPMSDPDDGEDSTITGTGASGPTAVVTPGGP